VSYQDKTNLVQFWVQNKMEFLDEGKAVFRLRSRLCSSLYSVNEKIREFFLEYDRYILKGCTTWGPELLEVLIYDYIEYGNYCPNGRVKIGGY